jgi:hypothetical protein
MQPSKGIHSPKSKMISFIVRCWPQSIDQSIVWRGEAQEVESGQKTAFPNLEQMLQILNEMLDAKTSAHERDSSENKRSS